MAKTPRRTDETELKSLLERLLLLLNKDKETEGRDERPDRPFLCAIQPLPREKWVAAAQTAVQINPANRPATHLLGMSGITAMADMASPESLAVVTSKYWGSSGVKLSVGFLEPIQQDLKDRILSHMNAWSDYANVQFFPSNTNPQVRITRGSGGYKSYLGTDILHTDPNGPTMWLQGFAMSTDDSEFHRVIRHETGHTLGFPHEHTRQEIVDQIDREKAIAYFMKTQGWSREEVIAQVLTPLAQSAIVATAHADPDSIMCYSLPGAIMEGGQEVPGGTDIDSQDQQFAALIYPKTGAAPTLMSQYY
jgi:hypothetical protein